MRMVYPACLSIVNNTALSVSPVDISSGINEDIEKSAIFVDKAGHNFLSHLWGLQSLFLSCGVPQFESAPAGYSTCSPCCSCLNSSISHSEPYLSESLSSTNSFSILAVLTFILLALNSNCNVLTQLALNKKASNIFCVLMNKKIL